MVRPKDADSERTTALILDAALQLISETASTELQLRAIAKRAGVSTGTISYYFGSKEELIEACFDSYYARLTEQSREMIGTFQSRTDSAELIEHAGRAFFRFAHAERRILFLRQRTNIARGELHPRRQQEFMGFLIRDVALVIAPHVGLPPAEVRITVQALVAILMRFALMSDPEMEAITDHTGDEGRALLEGFAGRAARRLLRPQGG